MKNGSMNSDCGYFLDVEGCECSMFSFNEGFDIFCDGRCSSYDGKKICFLKYEYLIFENLWINEFLVA